MKPKLLLCTDLDRTVIPNGDADETPGSLALFRLLVSHPDITLVYVSGRDQHLLKEAIAHYELPSPNYAIGDVGTTIYAIDTDGNWQPWPDWHTEIAPNWNGKTREELHALLADVAPLRLQEVEKQNTFKLSYYLPIDADKDNLLSTIEQRMKKSGIRASVIWSVDEQANTVLLDILPANATKLHGILFLAQNLGFETDEIVFAGDSGNDLPVVTSEIASILVKNAHPDVIAQAHREAEKFHTQDKLYIAQGDVLSLNGNYSAGVIEGVLHYFPKLKSWLTRET